MEILKVERSIWIAAPREKVWQAITQPAQLEQWFAVGCRWEIPSLKAGEVVKFYNTETDIQRATIELIEPLRLFTLRWEADQEYPNTTLVTSLLLEEENEGTRITMTESGYETLPGDLGSERADQTAEGYRMSLETLKAYLEGRSMPD
jgi:uncharacterized protein YndB with AHSA1/START domain